MAQGQARGQSQGQLLGLGLASGGVSGWPPEETRGETLEPCPPRT